MTETKPDSGAAGRPGSLLRELSEQAVLEAIFRDGPITRPELAERTNLSRPTVADAVRRLMQERLIRSAGVRPGKLGRSPVSYVVDEAAGFVIGVDVGGSNIRVAAVNIYGELLTNRTVAQRTDGSKTLAQQVRNVVRETTRTVGATHSYLLAIGGSANPAVLDHPDDDPFALLRPRNEVPMFIDNTVNLSAAGEKWRGLAKGVSDFAFVSVGADVRVGIVVADELVRGSHGAAGDVNGLPAVQSNSIPGFGHVGPMDAVSVLAEAGDMPWRNEPPTSIAALFALLDTEPSARLVVEAQARRIAYVVASVCAMLDPEIVVLGGGIGSMPELLEPVRNNASSMLRHPVRIESTLLRDEAALYGALASGLQEAHDHLLRRGTRTIGLASAAVTD